VPVQQTHWEHFQHGADIGIRGYGTTLGQAFEQAALALSAVICDPDEIQPLQAVSIHCSSDDNEILFVEWIDAIVYEIATRRMLFSQFQVTINDQQLNATIYGEPIDIPRHAPAVEVKGATLTALSVAESPAGLWRAQCVVDV
jgi:SHS2 domain-containing protein